MLEMTRTDPEWKDKIITSDETWVYGYDPETKRQSAEWRGQDIAPNDFFLFPKLKAVLKGRHFDTRDDIIEKSPLALKSIPKEAYKNCFDNWEKRWRCSRYALYLGCVKLLLWVHLNFHYISVIELRYKNAVVQVTLLEESWKDLFLINLAQWSVTVDVLGPMLRGLTRGSEEPKEENGGPSLSGTNPADLHYIQEILRRFRQLSPDDTECSSLKAIIIFKPDFSPCDFFLFPNLNKWLGGRTSNEEVIDDIKTISTIKKSEHRWARQKCPRQPTRFGRLLLLTPCLRSVSNSAVERFFFKDTIGDISIERILGDMYHMERPLDSNGNC
ncbi:dsf [Cordylochernes scorpioides]|uniref:Dsf n=1 Tax=Cordylochernes scorpioides TaxID=51811 RepID=A0ABY6K484_9ARAC|nr:dsf [Cordylochernes scorpioides]